MLIGGYGQAGRTPGFGPAQLADFGSFDAPDRPPLPPADGERTRANRLDVLAGVLPFERCNELATLREDGNRDRRFTGVQARKAVQGAKRLGLARDTTGARSASAPAALRLDPQNLRPTENTRGCGRPGNAETLGAARTSPPR